VAALAARDKSNKRERNQIEKDMYCNRCPEPVAREPTESESEYKRKKRIRRHTAKGPITVPPREDERLAYVSTWTEQHTAKDGLLDTRHNDCDYSDMWTRICVERHTDNALRLSFEIHSIEYRGAYEQRRRADRNYDD